MIWSNSVARPDAPVRPGAVGRSCAADLSKGSAACHSSIASLLSTARMKASVTATVMLKFDERAVALGVDEVLDVRVVAAHHPHLRAAPAPADSSVSQLLSNTRMYEIGPLARECVPLTSAPRGRIGEKS